MLHLLVRKPNLMYRLMTYRSYFLPSMHAAFSPALSPLKSPSGTPEKNMAEYLIDDKSKIILTDRRVIFSSRAAEESIGLSKISVVKVAFKRSLAQVIAGTIMLIISLGFIALWKDVETGINNQIVKVDRKFKEFNSKVTGDKPAEPRGEYINVPVGILWLLGSPFLVWAVFLIYSGWRGETALVIKNFSEEISHIALGRDPSLIQFGQDISQRLA